MAFPLCSQVPSALQSGLWCLPVRMLLSEQSRLCPAVGLRPQAPDSDWNLRLGPSPRPAAVTSDRGRGCRGKPKGVEGWAAGNSSEMFLTQALTSCVLSGQPWNLPHPIHHPGIFCKTPSWGWVGGGLGGSGLTVPVPERVQLATLQACLMSTGGSQRRCLQPPNPICLHRILGDRVHAVSGCTLAHMWRLHRGEQVGCVIQALSSIHRIVVPFCSLPPHFPLPHLQFSLCLFIPDRSVPDLAIPSVLLPSAPQFLYLSYGGSTTALS